MSDGAGRDPGTLMRQGREALAAAGVPSPEADARTLLRHAVSQETDRSLEILDEIPETAAETYRGLVARRATREPLQHILGHVSFRHVDLTVRPGVFIPRPETEIVAGVALDAALQVADPHGNGRGGRVPRVVDLCCGTGAIALSLAWETRGGAEVVAVDISEEAVRLATENLAAYLDGLAPHRVLHGDVTDPGLLADLRGTVDVVVSNPPYIPDGAVPRDPEVVAWDPARALYGGGDDGLTVPRGVVERAAELLRDGGVFVMEHGDVQGADMRELVRASGRFERTETGRDLTERDRYVRAVRRGRGGGGRLGE